MRDRRKFYGVNGAGVISSPSSKTLSLPSEKSINHHAAPVIVWNQFLQFALASEIEETTYVFHVIPLLIEQQRSINKNNLTLAEVIGRSVAIKLHVCSNGR